MAATVYTAKRNEQLERGIMAPKTEQNSEVVSLLEITQRALALLMEITETHEAKKEGFERPLFHNKKMVSLLHSPL